MQLNVNMDKLKINGDEIENFSSVELKFLSMEYGILDY